MNQLIFKDPLWLLALLALPLILWLRSRRSVPVLLVPFAAAWHRPSLAGVSRLPVFFGFSALVLLVVALARPQRVEDKREVRSQGYDIMLCIDVSHSMLREDHARPGIGPNRIQTIKPIIQNFIERRPHDRIGLVLFGRKAYTLSPLTSDHDWIGRQLSRLEIGMVESNGTAIGDGLGTALNRLTQADKTEDGRRLGAFVVLMTDGGESTIAGKPISKLPPLEAAQIARSKNIPIHAIGVGGSGISWAPEGGGQYTRVAADLDEGLLYNITTEAKGQLFRAEDKSATEKAFDTIDKAQKIEFQAQSYLVATELFWWPAAPAIVLLIAAGLLARPLGWTRTASAASKSSHVASSPIIGTNT